MICPLCRKNLIGIVQATRYLGKSGARHVMVPACLTCGHVVRLLRMPKDYEVPSRKTPYVFVPPRRA